MLCRHTWNAIDCAPGSSHVAKRMTMKQLMAADRLPPMYSRLRAQGVAGFGIVMDSRPTVHIASKGKGARR